MAYLIILSTARCHLYTFLNINVSLVKCTGMSCKIETFWFKNLNEPSEQVQFWHLIFFRYLSEKTVVKADNSLLQSLCRAYVHVFIFVTQEAAVLLIIKYIMPSPFRDQGKFSIPVSILYCSFVVGIVTKHWAILNWIKSKWLLDLYKS